MKRFILSILASALLLFGVVPGGPAQTTAVWSKLGSDGYTVSIPAGAPLRYGAKAGTPYGCGDGPVLAADAWVTPKNTSATIVTPDALGVPDPANCYVKELDAQQVAAAPASAPPAPVATAPPSSPTWVTIAAEIPTLSVTLPAGTHYRFGTPSCPAGTVLPDGSTLVAASPEWTEVTVTAVTTISPVSMAGGDPFPFDDPCSGTLKELDVEQTALPQLVVMRNTATTIPTAPTMVVPPLAGALPVAAGQHMLVFTNFSIAPNSPDNALMFAFVNQPADGGNRTWEGTQMDLLIDGVHLVCSYGQTYTDGVFSLSCAQ